MPPARRGDASRVECFQQSLSVRAPAFCASRMIGSTFAAYAYLSASDFTGLI
jgi:hypothetical protein